jgi:hypothetical protein
MKASAPVVRNITKILFSELLRNIAETDLGRLGVVKTSC